jgi:hypothetical protein
MAIQPAAHDPWHHDPAWWFDRVAWAEAKYRFDHVTAQRLVFACWLVHVGRLSEWGVGLG